MPMKYLILAALVMAACTDPPPVPATEEFFVAGHPFVQPVVQPTPPTPEPMVIPPPVVEASPVPEPVTPPPPAPIVVVEHPPEVVVPAPQPPARVCTQRYYLTLETRMHSVSLNPMKFIRNKMNATIVEIPTDMAGFNHAMVGEELDRSFDGYGLFFRGHIQAVETKVTNKRMVCE